MIRVVSLAILIAITCTVSVRADWPSSCPGGVCPARNVATAPAVVMTAAPAIRILAADSPPVVFVPVEREPLSPVVRAFVDNPPIVAPVRRIVRLPFRLIRWFRNNR